MNDIKKIADEADLIVNGYAFTKKQDAIYALNLNNPEKATVFTIDGIVVETSMDDIEINIVLDYFKRNRKFMEG